MRVGVRELKAQLSRFLSEVADGEEIVVTDRGRPVARLVAYAAPSDVERGIDEGWIDAPTRNRLARSVDRSRSEFSIADALDEDRRDGDRRDGDRRDEDRRDEDRRDEDRLDAYRREGDCR